MLARMWSSRNSHSLLMGLQHGAATVEGSLQFLIKLSVISRYFLASQKTMSNQNLYMNEHSSFIHNWQNLEATQLSFKKWMDKLWFLQKMKYLAINKKEAALVRYLNWLRVSSRYTNVVGLIPGQGTYKKQPMNASISGTTNRCFSLSLPLF